MSTLGIVMLVHTAFDRAEQVIRHWVAGGCPVVVHVDAKVPDETFEAFRDGLQDLATVRFCERHRCEWGMWGLVAATQSGAAMLLTQFPQVRHAYLASGSCLPLRSVAELRDYLDARPRTDFIESVNTVDVPWTVGGLDVERFTLRFPFSWKKRRWVFDKCVSLQRRLRMQRKIPAGLTPHMGSQWWCLTRQTLSAILQDPDRKAYDRYFKQVWIPDESYFQTLARTYSRQIESRSLTLSKFDFQGKPHIFYDDHLHLLRRSDCFVARKVWPRAERLYQVFLSDDPSAARAAEPNPGRIDRLFAKAVDRRTHGRPGLYMQSRWPAPGQDSAVTCAPYAVFEGFAELFENFEEWLAKQTKSRVHGHLFHPERAFFEGGQCHMQGALSDHAAMRDHNPQMFLTNLIWNTRGDHQAFQFGPSDRQEIAEVLARDRNAQISVISGAWAVPLFLSNRNFADIRAEAAQLQRIEDLHLRALRSAHTKARVRVWTMADFVDAPMEALQSIIDEMTRNTVPRLTEAPRMVDLQGFGQFLQNLKNQGMNPYLTGDFPVTDRMPPAKRKGRKPYLVGK